MSSLSNTIKNKIKDKLDALVPDTLGQVIIDDFRVDPDFKNLSKYPAAIVGSPAYDSEYLTNRENLRTFTFDVVVVQKAENVASITDIEDLTEALLDAFDNDPTLGGAAEGAVEPTASAPAALTSADQSFIVFVIQVKAKAVKSLSF